MLREVCFCGWAGCVEDREPVYMADGEWALQCPACGRLDSLHWLAAALRRELLKEAERRQCARRQFSQAPNLTGGSVVTNGAMRPSLVGRCGNGYEHADQPSSALLLLI